MTKPGADYEGFVERLVQAILAADEYFEGSNIAVEKNKVIKDNCGIPREFDVYWEYEFGDFFIRR